MRTFEIILSLVLALRIIAGAFLPRRGRNALTIAVILVMLMQILVEGTRWQMIPLYIFTLGFGIAAVWPYIRKQAPDVPSHRGWKTVGGLLLLGICLLLPILMPIPSTPAPTGPYPVGTFTLMMVDESRQELYSDDPNQPRALMVQFWYPAQPGEADTLAPWMDHIDIMGPAIASELGLPPFALSHVRYARSHAYAGAPLSTARERYPLLLFSHGWNGFRAQNTFQMEELASHGYIIAAPDHAYGGAATVFEDGRVALNNPDALPYDQDLPQDEFLARANQLGIQWAEDLSFILDQLEMLQTDDEGGSLVGHLDYDRIGALGHSTGGGAAIEFCAQDPRCQSVLGMDPYMEPVSRSVLEEGISLPVMAIFSQAWYDDWENDERGFEQFYANTGGWKLLTYLQGTTHMDFSDVPAFSPLAPYLGLKGPLNGERVLEIVRAYSLAFFDHTLLGKQAPLLEGPSGDYPEMIFVEQ
jgi:predicted dienelactone hydrolase